MHARSCLELSNLRLRKEALIDTDLPFVVHRGTIGTLTLTIPWANLSSSPAIIRLSQVDVVLVSSDVDPSCDERRAQAAKLRDLQQHELRKAAGSDASSRAKTAATTTADVAPATDAQSSGGASSGSFMTRVAASLINNLQFFVDSVHVRFVDFSRMSETRTATVCGTLLRQLSGQSTNELWEAMFVPASAARLYKVVRIEHIAW